MNIWEKITEAQARKQQYISFSDEGSEVQMRVIPNGWYEGYVSMSMS